MKWEVMTSHLDFEQRQASLAGGFVLMLDFILKKEDKTRWKEKYCSQVRGTAECDSLYHEHQVELSKKVCREGKWEIFIYKVPKNVFLTHIAMRGKWVIYLGSFILLLHLSSQAQIYALQPCIIYKLYTLHSTSTPAHSVAYNSSTVCCQDPSHTSVTQTTCCRTERLSTPAFKKTSRS